jgi:hypothetical protein
MTSYPIPSECPYIYEENFVFFFISVQPSGPGGQTWGKYSHQHVIDKDGWWAPNICPLLH